MLVVQVGIERLPTKKIKQVEEVATINQDCRHTKVWEKFVGCNQEHTLCCNMQLAWKEREKNRMLEKWV